jgi:sulfofructose kinase
MAGRRLNSGSNEGCMKASIDILGLGCTAVDEMLHVRKYPPADSKVPLLKRVRQCGGLTATALVAAARLGARCAYAGVLGEDPDSAFVLKQFREEGVNVRHTLQRRGARPVRSVIVVAARGGTRTIFYETEGVIGASPRHPSRRVIESCRVLFVDRFGMTGMIRAARIARRAGIPVVADLESAQEPRLEEWLARVDHLIVPLETARELTGKQHPAAATAALKSRGHQVVVVTWGNRGCWFQEAAWRLPSHHPAFPVKALDTTGCGDVFHGVYAAALAWGRPLVERVRLASGAAAFKAARIGGPGGIASAPELKRFLEQHRPGVKS